MIEGRAAEGGGPYAAFCQTGSGPTDVLLKRHSLPFRFGEGITTEFRPARQGGKTYLRRTRILKQFRPVTVCSTAME